MIEYYDRFLFNDVEGITEIVQATQDDCKKEQKLFQRLLQYVKKPLYLGCRNFTKLSALVKLYNLKVCHG